MGFFSDVLRNAADRVAYGLGNQEAAGRLNVSAATAEVRTQWNRYAGRKAISAPTIRHLSNFLELQYGVGSDERLIARLTGGATARDMLDMAVVLPRIADLLLDSGALIVERP